MIVEVFLRPLQAAATSGGSSRLSNESVASFDWTKKSVSITKEQVKSIFLEVESIANLNHQLLAELDRRFCEWSVDATIGDIFNKYVRFFKVYVTFSNNFDVALSTINTCRKKSSFKQFLEHCLELPECQRLWLDDHLIGPIQRIPRYVMLLKDLLRRTPPDHPDFVLLREAVSSYSKLATEINEAKGKAEQRLLTIQVQRMVKYLPAIQDPARLFVNDFPCTLLEQIHAPESAAARQDLPEGAQTALRELSDAVVYLFTDIVMVATHEQVDSILGRTGEMFKQLGRQVDYDRPVENTPDGQVIHKYKFHSLCDLSAVELKPISQDDMTFRMVQSDNVFYFRSPSWDEMRLLFQRHKEARAKHVEVLACLPLHLCEEKQNFHKILADLKMERRRSPRVKGNRPDSGVSAGGSSRRRRRRRRTQEATASGAERTSPEPNTSDASVSRPTSMVVATDGEGGGSVLDLLARGEAGDPNSSVESHTQLVHEPTEQAEDGAAEPVTVNVQQLEDQPEAGFPVVENWVADSAPAVRADEPDESTGEKLVNQLAIEPGSSSPPSSITISALETGETQPCAPAAELSTANEQLDQTYQDSSNSCKNPNAAEDGKTSLSPAPMSDDDETRDDGCDPERRVSDASQALTMAEMEGPQQTQSGKTPESPDSLEVNSSGLEHGSEALSAPITPRDGEGYFEVGSTPSPTLESGAKATQAENAESERIGPNDLTHGTLNDVICHQPAFEQAPSSLLAPDEINHDE
eukprot:TRINITY_DN9035_c0_g1_i1.p1 TRINITY_DN9035_c0_g1~~TRINITY_DN9035_c0_g1_i1.p1  ORF type:complete len:752 (+),score=177.00 TRINITY_DN9035_c0_g1_i1:980-3235(+)